MDDLPFFLGLMGHLATHGIVCPQPVKDARRRNARPLAGRPAAIIDFLEGVWPRKPNVAHCAAIGARWRNCISPARDFPMTRANALSVSSWRPLFEQAAACVDTVQQGLHDFLKAELDHLEAALAGQAAGWRHPCRSVS